MRNFAPLIVFATAASACHTAVRPPTQSAIGHYCLESAQEADARALRYRSIGVSTVAASALTLASAPFVAVQFEDGHAGAAVATAMATAAVTGAVLGLSAFERSEHNTAIASAFAGCIDLGDRRAAFAVARATYQLWIRPDVSRAELVRDATKGAAGPTYGPPEPPPWADEPGPEPSSKREPGDVLHVRSSPSGKKL